MSPQTETFMENLTFQQEKNKSVELLVALRETATLLDVINTCSEKQAVMSIVIGSEYDYHMTKAVNDSLEEIKQYCNERISKLKENQ